MLRPAVSSGVTAATDLPSYVRTAAANIRVATAVDSVTNDTADIPLITTTSSTPPPPPDTTTTTKTWTTMTTTTTTEFSISAREKPYAVVLVYIVLTASMISTGSRQAFNISISFPLWIESNALWKSTKVIIAGRFFDLIPSTSLCEVSICATVDLPFLKPF